MSENQSITTHSYGEPSWHDQGATNSCLAQPVSNTASGEAVLGDSIKALNCLLNITEILEANRSNLPKALSELVQLLPPALQYPDACRVRLIFDDHEYHSSNFQTSNWRQVANIVALEQKRGTIEVYYLEQISDDDEGSFLKEEQELVNLVAKRIASHIEHCQLEQKLKTTLKELQVERAALQQSNASLHSALERATAEKQATQEAIVSNVDKVFLPLLRALDQELPVEKKKYVTLLRDSLQEITSPFADKLSRAFMSLTAVEIRICQMIRDGLTTKDIAQKRNVSPATVARQRERIRHKLGLIGTDTNLATYLRTFLVERP